MDHLNVVVKVDTDKADMDKGKNRCRSMFSLVRCLVKCLDKLLVKWLVNLVLVAESDLVLVVTESLDKAEPLAITVHLVKVAHPVVTEPWVKAVLALVEPTLVVHQVVVHLVVMYARPLEQAVSVEEPVAVGSTVVANPDIVQDLQPVLAFRQSRRSKPVLLEHKFQQVA